MVEKPKKQIETPAGKPSQAEGEREIDDQSTRVAKGRADTPAGKPSQAEGDRETIEESLKQKDLGK